MAPVILLVDDQHDILRLLHSALDTLQKPELEILEASSGESALQIVGDRRVDLLVTDYNLPGINGMEMMHRTRAGQPDIRVILITGGSDRGVRDEMLNAGAVAVFSKPIPLGDFLYAVERGLGLTRTSPPVELDQKTETRHVRVSELLANFRQDIGADAVFLINNRGQVAQRAGDLRDSSMEVSLISALTAAFSAGLKVAESNRQENLDQYAVFQGGDQDLILMPVDPTYLLLLAGKNLSAQSPLAETVQAIKAVKEEIGKGLRHMGATGPLPKKRVKTGGLKKSAPDMDVLLSSTPTSGLNQEDLDAYWDAAAAQHANKPMSKDVIPYDEARKMGLTPDKAEE